MYAPTTLREKEMSKTYKILVPKPASSNKDGTDIKLYQADEVVDAKEGWQEDIMSTFIENGWAMEVKVSKGGEEEGEAGGDGSGPRARQGGLRIRIRIRSLRARR